MRYCNLVDAFEAVSKTENIYLFCQVWTVTNAVLKNHRMHLVGDDTLGLFLKTENGFLLV